MRLSEVGEKERAKGPSKVGVHLKAVVFFIGCGAVPTMSSASSLGSSENSGKYLEEVYVTATKRSESLSDIPLSVSAISGDKLNDAGVVQFEELSGAVPNFSVSSTPIGDVISIRGISSGGQPGTEQSVATFVDGVYRGRGAQSRFNFLDLGVLEIVRGPQGALFGKNTIAGALNITSARPTENFEAEISLSREIEYEESELKGYISGPASNKLKMRFAGLWREQNKGWVENAYYDETLPESKVWAGRLSFVYDLNDDLSFFAKLEKGSFEYNGQPFELIQIYDGPDPELPELNRTVNDEIKENGAEGNINGKTVIGNAGPLDLGTAYVMDGDNQESLIKFDWVLGPGLLSGVYANSSYDFYRALDADNGPLSILNIVEYEDFDQDSVEVKYVSDYLGKTSFILGVYWQEEDLRYGNPKSGNYGDFSSIGVPVPVVQRNVVFNQNTKYSAAFGQLSYQINNELTAVGSVRYNHDEKTAMQSAGFYDLDGNDVSPDLLTTYKALFETTPHEIDLKRKENSWSYSGTLQWDVNDESMLYAAYSTGGKSGGFNAFYFATGGMRESESNADFQNRMEKEAQYKPESTRSIEIGFKTLITSASEIQIAIFESEYNDLQAAQFTGATTFVVGNAAEAKVEGVEIDSRWKLSEVIDVYGNVGWIRFRFKDYKNAGCTAYQALEFGGSVRDCSLEQGNDLTGRPNSNTPEWTSNLGVVYGEHIFNNYHLKLGFEAKYVSEFYASGDLDPASIQDDYIKMSSYLTLKNVARKWSLGLLINNITDERTYWDANDLPLATGTHRATIQKPRTIKANIKYEF